jgi:hypothetical protein
LRVGCGLSTSRAAQCSVLQQAPLQVQTRKHYMPSIQPHLMGNISKTVALIIIGVIAISGLSTLTVKPVNAQTITEPSVPEFTIEPVGPAFDIPPTYSFNASSGLFYINEGYHFEYSTVKVIIENQAFTNQTNIDHLFYNLRIKPHNYPDSYWYEFFNPNRDGFPIQTSLNFTIIPIAAEGATELQYQIPAGATTDIQVQAMIGHIERGFNGNATNQIEMYPYVFVGQKSGWSDTHTVTLPPKAPIVLSPTTTPTSYQTPDIPRNPPHLDPIYYLIPVSVILAIVIVVILLYRRHRKTAD